MERNTKEKARPQQQTKCPRCNSTDTKFCYNNNSDITQPRYFCNTCRMYWTAGTYERFDTTWESLTENDPEIQEPSVRYDVFLSFRGKDTRRSFTSHLSSSLSNDGIVVFKDDTDLPRGKYISPELQIGIENSTISIVIFSKGYAGSRWCLNELSKIMEVHRVQGRVVLPVFYGVDPSEVRNQISSFGEAFQDLIQRRSPTHDQVLRWRTDLREAGGIAGFVILNSRNESEDIKNIVEKE